MGTVGPVIATALTASGVGAPIVGAVGAGIAMGESVLTALGIGQSHGEECGWRVNGFCGTGTRPYGPGDPTWVPLSRVTKDSKYAASFPLANGYWPMVPGGGPAPLAYMIDPMYATITSELRYLEGHGPNLQTSAAARDVRLNAFRLAFNRAYLAQLERAINGQKPVDPVTLLNQTALQWNASHAGPSVAIDSNQAMPNYWQGGSVDGVTSFSMGGSNGKHPGVFKQTFIERLLGGTISGSRQPPLSVNIGVPPKKTIAFHLAAKAPLPLPHRVLAAHTAHATPTQPHAVGGVLVKATSVADRLLPYAPVALGIALLPVAGPLAPAAGVAATAAWKWKHKA